MKFKITKDQLATVGVIAFVAVLFVINAIGVIHTFNQYKNLAEKLETIEIYNTEVYRNDVTINWVNDPVKVGLELQKRDQDFGYDVDGNMHVMGLSNFSYNSKDNECTIWAYEPKGAWDTKYMQILGHEVLHCFRGNFHRNPEEVGE